jgi:signal recognition particle GTPase
MQCMTDEEKQNPDMLVKSAKRKRQLARDSGRSQADVNDMLTTFTQMRVQMKTISKLMAQSGGMGARCCYAFLESHCKRMSTQLGRPAIKPGQSRLLLAQCSKNYDALE